MTARLENWRQGGPRPQATLCQGLAAGRVAVMTTSDRLATSPETAQLRHARAVLAALSDGSGLEALPAAEALATLNLTHPPYPPVTELPAGGGVTHPEAIQALAAAALAAADPAEAARISCAALALRTPLSPTS